MMFYALDSRCSVRVHAHAEVALETVAGYVDIYFLSSVAFITHQQNIAWVHSNKSLQQICKLQWRHALPLRSWFWVTWTPFLQIFNLQRQLGSSGAVRCYYQIVDNSGEHRQIVEAFEQLPQFLYARHYGSQITVSIWLHLRVPAVMDLYHKGIMPTCNIHTTLCYKWMSRSGICFHPPVIWSRRAPWNYRCDFADSHTPSAQLPNGCREVLWQCSSHGMTKTMVAIVQQFWIPLFQSSAPCPQDPFASVFHNWP